MNPLQTGLWQPPAGTWRTVVSWGVWVAGYSLGLLRGALWDKGNSERERYCKAPIWWLSSWDQFWGPCQWSPPLNAAFPKEMSDLGRDRRRRQIFWEEIVTGRTPTPTPHAEASGPGTAIFQDWVHPGNPGEVELSRGRQSLYSFRATTPWTNSVLCTQDISEQTPDSFSANTSTDVYQVKMGKGEGEKS